MIEDLDLNEIISSGPEIAPIPASDALDDAAAALSPILYEKSYKDGISYLRALMGVREYTPRAISLTQFIIARNPAHYTVWTYRLDTLLHLSSINSGDTLLADTIHGGGGTGKDWMREELTFIESLAEQGSKNYQLWHHREGVMTHLYLSPSVPAGTSVDEGVSGLRGGGEDDLRRSVTSNVMSDSAIRHEKEFLDVMLQEDGKNYHVWCYRQWLAKKFPDFRAGEEAMTRRMVSRDPYNNSAWHYRFFLLYHLPSDDDDDDDETSRRSSSRGEQNSTDEERGEVTTTTTTTTMEEDLAYVRDSISAHPDNVSAWSYFRGLLQQASMGAGSQFLDWATYFSDHLPALEFQLRVHEEAGDVDRVEGVCDLLMRRDVIRRKYWAYRRGLCRSETR